ncbi:hypothetical protein BH10PSE16_BH10PSE16_24700 [soil metagenome]
MASRTFPSRVDGWLIAVVTGAIGFTLFQGWLLRAVSPLGSGIALGVGGAVALLIAATAVPCTYTLMPEHLLIRTGLIRQQIAYRDITGIEPSTSPLSAPALSLQRVKVSYGDGGRFQLVSPRERELFIRALRERVARVRPAP